MPVSSPTPRRLDHLARSVSVLHNGIEAAATTVLADFMAAHPEGTGFSGPYRYDDVPVMSELKQPSRQHGT
jgi:hypothetical protein